MFRFKTIFRSAFLVSLLSFGVIYAGCDKDDDDDDDVPQDYTLSGNASAANEVPAQSTTTYPGTGTIAGSYNPNTNLLTYTITYTGLSGNPTMAHFHGPAAVTENASAVVTFNVTGLGTAGTISGTTTLTETQEAELLAGRWYYNIHTAARGGGEIRGQVTARR